MKWHPFRTYSWTPQKLHTLENRNPHILLMTFFHFIMKCLKKQKTALKSHYSWGRVREERKPKSHSIECEHNNITITAPKQWFMSLGNQNVFTVICNISQMFFGHDLIIRVGSERRMSQVITKLLNTRKYIRFSDAIFYQLKAIELSFDPVRWPSGHTFSTQCQDRTG